MKLAHHLALALGFTLGMAFSEEVGGEVLPYTGIYAASGLTITETQDSGVTISGWYDIDKTPEADVDDYMCYAASAANLIAWWQDGSNASESDAPSTLDDIWNTFIENNQLPGTGGTPLAVINWWISGVYSPSEYITNTVPNAESGGSWTVLPESDPLWDRFFMQRNDLVDDDGQPVPIPVSLPNLAQKGESYFSGYYFDRYGLTKESLSNFLTINWMFKEPVETPDESEPEADESAPPAGSLTLPAAEESEVPVSICNINFAELLEGSPISLGIYSDDGKLAHSVTLWAVEYDNNGNLTTIWLTDSDDYENRIFSVQVTLDKEENKIYFGTLVEGEGEEEDDYYSTDYAGIKDIFIGTVFSINPTESAQWTLVPEPSTATLSLLALACLAARRRRATR